MADLADYMLRSICTPSPGVVPRFMFLVQSISWQSDNNRTTFKAFRGILWLNIKCCRFTLIPGYWHMEGDLSSRLQPILYTHWLNLFYCVIHKNRDVCCDTENIDVSDPSPIYLTTNLNKKPRQTIWKLNSCVPHSLQCNEAPEKKIQAYLELNDTGKVRWDTFKLSHEGSVITQSIFQTCQPWRNCMIHDFMICCAHIFWLV